MLGYIAWEIEIFLVNNFWQSNRHISKIAVSFRESDGCGVEGRNISKSKRNESCPDYECFPHVAVTFVIGTPFFLLLL